MSEHDALKAELIRTDEEFRHLHEQHQSYEKRLEELNHKSLLSEEDELEEKHIKRQKLILKDRMAALLRQHEEAHQEAGVPA